MAPRDGFGFDPGVLDTVVSQMGEATTWLSPGFQAEPQAADAGDSSDEVTAALVRVIEAGAILEKVISDTAEKVNTAHGNYDDMDNSSADTFAQNERMSKSVHPHDPGPLLDSPKERRT